MTRRLALFDLDNTLLAGDSDHAWGEFLIAEKLVDPTVHRQTNDQFYQQYLEGELDIHGYVQFTIGPIVEYDLEQRKQLHSRFMQSVIMPMMLNKSRELVANHKDSDDCCVIITATNSFITAPIASELGINQLLATDLEVADGKYTGRIQGTPCYQQGKVEKLKQWLRQTNCDLAIEDGVFYSDSINDLPLLERVAEPIAVDADEKLTEVARARGWQQMSLRNE